MVRYMSSPLRSMLKRTFAMHAFLSAVIIATLGLSGCAIRLIGDYDLTIDQGVTDVQQKAELYFAKLLSTPNTTYDQSFYDDVHSRLAVLKSRASSLPKYPIIVEQIKNLQSQFDNLQKLDSQASRPIAPAIVNDAESAITVSVESILKLELALKRGGQTPPALIKKP